MSTPTKAEISVFFDPQNADEIREVYEFALNYRLSVDTGPDSGGYHVHGIPLADAPANAWRDVFQMLTERS